MRVGAESIDRPLGLEDAHTRFLLANDRPRRRPKLTRQFRNAPPRSMQLDHLPPELRRVPLRSLRLGHEGLLACKL